MAGRRRCCWSGALVNWLGNYDDVQNAATCLLYVQVVIGTVGSLSALYSGILVANLALALFALVAIESRSQALGRAYAAFLATSIVIDISWFLLFTTEIRHSTEDKALGPKAVASAMLALVMQTAGLCVRIISSVFWIQMYRIGLSAEREAQLQGGFDPQDNIEADITDRFLERNPSLSQEYLGGTIFNPTAFSSINQGSYQQYCSPESAPPGSYQQYCTSEYAPQGSYQPYGGPEPPATQVKEESASWTAPVSVDEEAMALFEQAEQNSRRSHSSGSKR